MTYLYKVRPLIDHVAAVFPEYYQPSRNISIDEMMISTRCFLQVIPKKLIRFGIKVWVCAEANSGYVLDFQVYSGASDEKKDKRISLGHQVVMNHLQGKGYCLLLTSFI